VKFLKIMAVIVAVFVAGTVIVVMFNTHSWNYKITVNIETPEGMKSGSAVRKVINRGNTLFGIKFPEVAYRISSVKGEAVVIDLGKRGVVFALIEHGSYDELYWAFSVRDASNTTRDFRKLKAGANASFPKENWPQFVTFKNISDPKSVVLVHGRRFDVKAQDMLPVDDVEEILGKGVKIESVTIEIVNEPVTWGIVDKYLSEDFFSEYHEWVKSEKITGREFTRLFQFQQGK
jgi:hypothetical protein